MPTVFRSGDLRRAARQTRRPKRLPSRRAVAARSPHPTLANCAGAFFPGGLYIGSMSDTPENQYKAPGDLTPVKWYASPTRRFLGLVLYVLSAGFGCAAILLLTRGLRYLLGYT